MAKKTPTQTFVRNAQTRPSITFELAQSLCPDDALVSNLARVFSLDPADYTSVRESTEEHVALAAKALQDTLSGKAMQIHLQRIVGAYVTSAHGAGQFYQQKVSQARDLTSKLANEDRDEDRDGGTGFETKAERARLFAAEMGLQAYALLAAGEGAVSAYAHITGEDWKPYEPPAMNTQGIARRSATEQMAALGG